MSEVRKLVLASASTRRQELLRQIGVTFQIVNHAIVEIPWEDEAPHDFAARMAMEKAIDVLARIPGDQNVVVLGADTVVVSAGQLLGKPQDRDDAVRMLSLLSGTVHQVYSALAVCDRDNKELQVVETEVEFRTLGAAEIRQYWESGEPRDKAGAYAIQGLAAVFVKNLRGSHSAVVGLPLFETALLLNKFSIPCWVPGSASGNTSGTGQPQ